MYYAEAKSVSPSKEAIYVNGELFLKSVNKGKWNFISVVEFDGGYHYGYKKFVGHCRTEEAALKYQPFPLYHELSMPESLKDKDKVAQFMADYPNAQYVQKRSKWGSYRVLRAPIDYKRSVVKIVRN